MEDDEKESDRTVFIISFVPLKIISEDNDILWINERPSSIRYCRPIKFEFTKETPSKTLQEYNFYTEEIRKLIPTIITKDEISFTVTHDIKCTMIDGKVCNVLTDQKSSASCNICGAKPNQMNDLNLVMSLKENKENYKFGLSTLHCWIRFMECILHIAYNMDFKKSYASGQNKVLKQNKKKKIQRELKLHLSISVDFVRQGYGTTNDGNTARRFFEEPEKVAKILQIDANLIRKFGTILQILSCGLEVDLDKFEKYAIETAKLFIQHYSWYKMPPAIHKVLIHGRKIMEELSIPIGHLSEEAQEASNKIFKNARAHNSRFCSRVANNEDTLHFLLISSDPLISAIRLKKDKKVKELTQEAKQLLKNSIYGEEILFHSNF